MATFICHYEQWTRLEREGAVHRQNVTTWRLWSCWSIFAHIRLWGQSLQLSVATLSWKIWQALEPIDEQRVANGRYSTWLVSLDIFPRWSGCSSNGNKFPAARDNYGKEMSNWIGPAVKQVWNYAIHVLHNFFRFNINTTAFCLGRSSFHLLLLNSSMITAVK